MVSPDPNKELLMAWSPVVHDLTRPMTHQTLVELAGKLVAEGSPVADLELTFLRNYDRGDNGAQCQWTLNDHFGTHIDAPVHILPNTPAVDQLDLRRLLGEAVVLDCSFANGRGLTAADFERARPKVEPGDIVLIYSAEQAGTLENFLVHQTYVTESGAEWLVKREISAVGVEPFGFEHVYEGLFVRKCYRPEVKDPWPAHRVCLSANVYIIEGLTNLAPIVGKRVHFSALPLRVPGSSGSPVRAVAWEE
jgi:arylformamidase